MARQGRRVLIRAVSCSFVLSGCVGTKEQVAATAGPPPANYKALAADYVKTNFFDPYSMRDVQISAPHNGQIYFQQGWVTCVKMNAKNRMGAYTGIQQTGLLFVGGKVANSFPGMPACGGADYLPWPEMDSAKPRA